MVYFLVEWEKNKSNTWSGTCLGLYTALSKRINITDINIKESVPVLFYRKILRRIGIRDMGLSKMKHQAKKVMALLPSQKEVEVFQFAEVISDKPNLKTYIYQDLSVSYVKYMAENLPHVFQVSGFQGNPKASIDRHAFVQDKYYENCAGIFTMGKWYAKDLVERCGIPSNKVHHVGGGINLDRNLIDTTLKKGNKILFVGRNFTRKGGPLVYEAFCHLKKTRPDAELYVVGPTDDPYPHSTVPGYMWRGGGRRTSVSRTIQQMRYICNALDI